MKKTLVSLLVISAYCLSLQANLSERQGTERFLLSGHGDIRVSINKGRQHDGFIPFYIDIYGVRLELCMDSEGRIYDAILRKAGMSSGRELFLFDPEKGQLRSGNVVLAGDLYERNDLRTRLRLHGMDVAIDLDIDRMRAIIDLGGIVIPVHVRLGKEVSGLRELRLGDMPMLREGRLFLDSGQGRLLLEDKSAADKRQSGMLSWAVKQ